MKMWDDAKIKEFQDTLLTWYDSEKRVLPWRKDHEPYHIWVSEIMLQQTQVNTVIPYYERFMDWFPTVEQFANAPEEKILKAWEGLGYYSRVRNMQKAAKQVVQDYEGQWPQTAVELQNLVGIGPYTAGAIASIAFNEVVPAVDGNAFRVFSRLFEIEEDIAKPQTRVVFEKVIQQVISKKRPGDFNQAIMDLGSSYMSAKNPDAEHSPVKAFNQAYLDGKELAFPVKSKKPRPVEIPYVALVIETDKGYLFEKRSSKGMLADLLAFPLIKVEELKDKPDEELLTDDVVARLSQWSQTNLAHQLAFSALEGQVVKHTFTHQKWLIDLFVVKTTSFDLSYFPGEFVSVQDFDQIAVPKVQQKIWDRYLSLSSNKS
ncbi:A/G-specific adenine glycosylase [Dellaglioa sp. L3N]